MNAAVGGMHATPPGARMANERRRELLEKAVAAKRLSLQQSPAAGAAASRPLCCPPQRVPFAPPRALRVSTRDPPAPGCVE